MCIHADAFDLLQWVVESKIQNEFKSLLKMVSKWLWNKRKEKKKNWKIKEFKKLWNLFLKAYQSCSFLFALKSIFEIIFEFDLVQSSNKFKPYLKMNLENQIRKRKEERKLSLPLPSIRPSSLAAGLLSLLLSLTSFSRMGLLLPAQFSFPLSLLLVPAQALSPSSLSLSRS